MKLNIKSPLLFIHEGKPYEVSLDSPQNGDLVLTDGYGVWEFRNNAPEGSKTCYAPLPYWANKDSCRKLVAR
jgi:hypothetical protein